MSNFKKIILGVFLVACDFDPVEPFEEYKIAKGTHGDFRWVQSLIADEINFIALFDESAIYESTIKENQYDVNKLLGFSDCNSHHHKHSARFGWRWLDGELEILAYCYASGERKVEYIGAIDLNVEHKYQIVLEDDFYVFRLDNLPEVRIKRDKPCDRGLYYMLWPYFGGDETPPHDVIIKIRMMY